MSLILLLNSIMTDLIANQQIQEDSEKPSKGSNATNAGSA